MKSNAFLFYMALCCTMINTYDMIKYQFRIAVMNKTHPNTQTTILLLNIADVINA